MNSVGPVGPSPHAEKTLEPFEHMVLIQADPAGQLSAAGTLSPSDYYHVGQAGPYVAGGPVGPDVYITDPNSLTHMVPIHADPDGQGATGGPDDYLPDLESCEHLVLDHADPAGQHTIDLDTAESLEYAVVENILDGQSMEGITCPELLEYSLRLLDATLDGGLVERISEWTLVINPALSYILDGRPMEGTTYPEHPALGVSLDSRFTEGAPCLEPLEQLVF